MGPAHESGQWTRSKVGVHGPLVYVLSSPRTTCYAGREKAVGGCLFDRVLPAKVLKEFSFQNYANTGRFTSQIYIQVLSMFYSPFIYDFVWKLCFLFSIKGVVNSPERHVPKTASWRLSCSLEISSIQRSD